MSKQIPFDILPPEQLITLIGLGDYFEMEGGPDVREEMTKADLIEEFEDMEAANFGEYVELSGHGDGGENAVYVTIWNGSIHIVTA